MSVAASPAAASAIPAAADHVGSYYAATANPAPERPTLAEHLSCDVCVIGGGFSGLSTALHLAEAGRSVVMLEANRIAWGATGRNGGQVVNGFNRDLDGIARRYGQDAANAIGGMCFEGSQIIRDRIKTYGINCDYKEGNLFAALTTRQLDGLLAKQQRWQQHGHANLEPLDAAKISQHVATDLYCGGLLDRDGGHLHPINLALGEAAALESLGGRIFEGSAALRMDQGNPTTVHTATGSVTATTIVACGNAYLGDLVPHLATRVLPASSQVVTTPVLGAAVTDRLLPTDHCVEDMSWFLDYYRITADKRLLFGGGTIYGGKDPADIRAELRPHIARTFPELADVELEYAWSGNIALTVSRVPHMGRLGDNLYFAHGYSGHGVTGSHTAGRLLAEAITQESNRLDVFGQLSHVPFPGGKHLRVAITTAGALWFRFLEKLGR